MASLEAAMKKHNFSIDSTSSSHGHALSTYGFSFNSNSTTTSSSYEWLIDSGESYHMDKDKAIFFYLNECNTKKLFVSDDRSLFVVGSRMVISMMYYVFQVFLVTIYQNIKSLIQVKVKPSSFHLTKL
jgi:hypothetical protein